MNPGRGSYLGSPGAHCLGGCSCARGAMTPDCSTGKPPSKHPGLDAAAKLQKCSKQKISWIVSSAVLLGLDSSFHRELPLSKME